MGSLAHHRQRTPAVEVNGAVTLGHEPKTSRLKRVVPWPFGHASG
jgi:hypothetical protein